MKFKLRLFELGATVLLSSSIACSSWADEGFFSKTPYGLESAWNNSVLIRLGPNAYGGFHTASGTILRQEIRGSRNYLYVLTAGHIADALNWPTGQAVTLSDRISVPQIFKEARLPELPVTLPGQNGASGTRPNGIGSTDNSLANARFIWGFLSYSPQASVVDAGLIIFELDKANAEFKPLSLAQDSEISPGESAIEIGFPAVMYRPASAQQVLIEEPGILKKRYSIGKYFGSIGPNNPGAPSVMGSSTDALPGNSGGAIFSSEGKIIGVASFVNQSSENNWAYDPNASWNVAFFSLESLRDFLKSSIHAFENTTP